MFRRAKARSTYNRSSWSLGRSVGRSVSFDAELACPSSLKKFEEGDQRRDIMIFQLYANATDETPMFPAIDVRLFPRRKLRPRSCVHSLND